MAINNPFDNKDGLGARIADEGLLSHFRWYDPLLIAGTAGAALPFTLAGMAAREGTEEAFKDAELPQSVEGAVGANKPAPDFTDQMIQYAAKQERDRLSSKSGRKASFLTGQAASTYLGG